MIGRSVFGVRRILCFDVSMILEEAVERKAKPVGSKVERPNARTKTRVGVIRRESLHKKLTSIEGRSPSLGAPVEKGMYTMRIALKTDQQ